MFSQQLALPFAFTPLPAPEDPILNLYPEVDDPALYEPLNVIDTIVQHINTGGPR